MKYRSILFSGPMVLAILEGRKTVTRRPVKFWRAEGAYKTEFSSNGFGVWRWDHHHAAAIVSDTLPCPYGEPGDRLWVRETWAIRACGRSVSVKSNAWPDGFPVDRVEYPATQKAPHTTPKGMAHWWNLRPSIHMPRWASRITLEATAVRVERLQGIDASDCYAEGIERPNPLALGSDRCAYDNARNAFMPRWDSIYAARGFGWEKNPWVWVVEFKRV